MERVSPKSVPLFSNSEGKKLAGSGRAVGRLVCVVSLRGGENDAQFGLLLPGKHGDSCLELGGVLLGKLSHQQSHFLLGVCGEEN